MRRLRRLHPDRASLLQRLVDGGKFSWDARDRRGGSGPRRSTGADNTWPRHYAALLHYGEEHGHCNVPHECVYRYEIPASDGSSAPAVYEGALGNWLHDQRQAQRGTGYGLTLRPDRHALLQTLVDEGKLSWNPSERYCSYPWEVHYAALLHYGATHGHCNVPHKLMYEATLTVPAAKIPDGKTRETGETGETGMARPGQTGVVSQQSGVVAGPTAEVASPTRIEHYQGHLGFWLSTQRQAKLGSLNAKKSAQPTPLPAAREALLQALVDQG